jgi:hypothetical protein
MLPRFHLGRLVFRINTLVIELFKMWHSVSTQGWAASMLALASCLSWLPTTTATTPVPAAPKLSFLYTAFVECDPDLMDASIGPRGIRKSIPIVGGNFSGPHLSGMNLVPIYISSGLTQANANRQDSRCRS